MLVGKLFFIIGMLAILLSWLMVWLTWMDLKSRLRAVQGMREETIEQLRRAKTLVMVAENDRDFAVCEKCQHIVNRYVHDENGVTCINCAADTTI